ncbi:MAG: T9SS type A sorting domain-containing protein [Candidatus Eisenbacteria sp.]|nr:T9SS type A sorting domain-containing protein [Candidatus Eisenbacteria bacterium]
MLRAEKKVISSCPRQPRALPFVGHGICPIVLTLGLFLAGSGIVRVGYTTNQRSLPPEPPPVNTLLPLAPGYCPSIGGSHLYESIQSVQIERMEDVLRITVNIYIANPTGCTAGSSCPEYDNSPEYINAWIDWDGDNVWEAGEKVLDVALTGYLGINYHGTMTAVRQVAIPPNAVPSTWMRTNLGWDYDPNDPCAYSWTWGDVHDQVVELDPIRVRVLKVETVDRVPIKDISPTLFERSYGSPPDCDLSDILVGMLKPVAAAFSRGALGLKVTLGYCPEPPSWQPRIVCSWDIDEAGIHEEVTTFGWEKQFNMLLPLKIGEYDLDIGFRVYDDEESLVDAVSLSGYTLYVTYDMPYLGEPLEEHWLRAATEWARNANSAFAVCNSLCDHIYGPAPLFYDPGVGFGGGEWKQFLAGNRDTGCCYHFGELWCKVGQILGIESAPAGYDEKYFITKTPAISLDNNTGNILNGSSHARDRWRFSSHSFGQYPLGISHYYDPTFGDKGFSDPEGYIQWYYTSLILHVPLPPELPSVVGRRFASEDGSEFVDLYDQDFQGFLAYHYYGPYPATPESPPAIRMMPASASGTLASIDFVGSTPSAAFTGSYSLHPTDTDADGRFNYLAVDVEVDVIEPEGHRLIGYLVKDDLLVSDRGTIGSSVPAEYPVAPEPGLNTVSARFSGEDIHRSGEDGLFTLYFSLIDATGAPIDNLVISTHLNHSDYSETPARILGITDQGIDDNGDGLFERLEVQASVAADVPGSYLLLGTLASDGTLVGATSSRRTLAAGERLVPLEFEGNHISRAGHDGPYTVTLSLEGDHVGVIHTRSFATSAYVHSQFQQDEAALPYLYNELPLDFDNDGLYDILRIEGQVTTAVAGSYRFSGWLQDGMGETIDLYQVAADLDAGPHTVQFDFAGPLINQHQVDGPFRLAFIAVHEEVEGLILTDIPAYMTSAYGWSEFAGPVQPLIMLTGECADFGRDTNANGLFDFLTVQVGVVCREEGVAIANARLIDPEGEEIVWAVGNAPVEANAPTVIEIDFDGRWIYGNMVDGPYHLGDVLVYHTGEPGESASMADGCPTSGYAAQDFEPAAIISGAVLYNGEPVGSAYISVEGADADFSNTQGIYKLTLLNDGHYRMTIDAPPGLDVESWQIFVNGTLVGVGSSVEVDVSVGEAKHVDFSALVNSPPEINSIEPALQNVQYSDAIALVIIMVSDPDGDPITVSAEPALNALVVAPVGHDTWGLSGQILQAAGTYEIALTASDGQADSEPATFTIVVEPEDVEVSFVRENPVVVEVTNPGDDSGPFSLSVDVMEFDDPDNVPGDRNSAGNISLADISMSLLPVGPGPTVTGSCSMQAVTPGLSDPDSPYDYDVSTVEYSFADAPVNTYSVAVEVNGTEFYVGEGEDVLVVSDPSLGFATGGGHFFWPGTAGPGTSYTGDRTSFGFNVKHKHKNNGGARGGLLVIRHLDDGSIFRLKGNAMIGIAIGESDDGGISFGWSSFVGKSTYQEPAWPEALGNYRFTVYVEDRGEPGADNDRFWIETRDRDGFVTPGLSLEGPAEANAVTLTGGNISVPHGGGGSKDGLAGNDRPVPEAFALGEIRPNPIKTRAVIRFQLPEPVPVSLVIYDISGRVVARVIDAPIDAGFHEAPWEAAGLSSGIYTCRIQAGTFVETQRVVVVR